MESLLFSFFIYYIHLVMQHFCNINVTKNWQLRLEVVKNFLANIIVKLFKIIVMFHINY